MQVKPQRRTPPGQAVVRSSSGAMSQASGDTLLGLNIITNAITGGILEVYLRYMVL